MKKTQQQKIEVTVGIGSEDKSINENSKKPRSGPQKKKTYCLKCVRYYADRRYFPTAVLNGDGSIREKDTITWSSIKNYILKREKHDGINKENKKKESSKLISPLQTVAQVVIENDSQCIGYVYFFLQLCSLRLVHNKEAHTTFQLPSDACPQPKFPRSWVTFFQSILNFLPCYQEPTINESIWSNTLPPTTATENSSDLPVRTHLISTSATENITSTTIENNGAKTQIGPYTAANLPTDLACDLKAMSNEKKKTILFVYGSCTSNPAGDQMSEYDKYNMARKDFEQYEKSLQHLLDSGLTYFNPNLYTVSDIKRMTSGDFSEFKTKPEEIITEANDKLKRIESLQHYFGLLDENYKELSVVKLVCKSVWMVLVAGIGQHYCKIAGRYHRKNKIFFTIRRATTEIRQHCHHSKCQQKHVVIVSRISVPNIHMLFCSFETLKKQNDNLTENEQKFKSEMMQITKKIKVKKRKLTPKSQEVIPSASPSPLNLNQKNKLLIPLSPYSKQSYDDDKEQGELLIKNNKKPKNNNNNQYYIDPKTGKLIINKPVEKKNEEEEQIEKITLISFKDF